MTFHLSRHIHELFYCTQCIHIYVYIVLYNICIICTYFQLYFILTAVSTSGNNDVHADPVCQTSYHRNAKNIWYIYIAVIEMMASYIMCAHVFLIKKNIFYLRTETVKIMRKSSFFVRMASIHLFYIYWKAKRFENLYMDHEFT